MTTQLSRVRWCVRAVLILGVAVSVTANVLHARPNPISQCIAAWPPIALLLTVELVSRVPVQRRGLAVARVLSTVTIAGIAAWVSYWHMAAVASRYGETGASAYLLPLSVDGLIVVTSVCLVELAERIRTVEAAVVGPVRTPPLEVEGASCDGRPDRAAEIISPPGPSPVPSFVPSSVPSPNAPSAVPSQPSRPAVPTLVGVPGRDPSRTVPDATTGRPGPGHSQDDTGDDLVAKARRADEEHLARTGRQIPRDKARPILGVSNERTSELLRAARTAVPDGPKTNGHRPELQEFIAAN